MAEENIPVNNETSPAPAPATPVCLPVRQAPGGDTAVKAVKPAPDKTPAIFEEVRGNIEIILIAFVLAMTIRCFCIDGYKIPSTSMEPTLIGNEQSGDRIIANKFGLFFRPVERFDVILFKPPIARHMNFVKRAVGLPGEEIKSWNGDIYYRKTGEPDFHIARKPLDIQESIWEPVWNWNSNLDEIKKGWELPPSRLFALTNDKLLFYANRTANDNDAVKLSLKQTVTDRYADKGGQHDVSDIKLSFQCRLNNPAGYLKTQINTYDNYFILMLSPTEENYLEYNGGRVASWKTRFTPLADHRVEILHYDGMIYIKVDKTLVAQYTYERLPEGEKDSKITTPQISLEPGKTEVLLWDINLSRDIYYEVDKVFSVPPHKYFALGDNVPNSKDSRAWKLRTIKLKDGRVIQCDDENFHPNSNYYEIKNTNRGAEERGGDIWGNDYKIPFEEVLEMGKPEECSFVEEGSIFGTALFVYWPLDRLKLIR